MRRTTTLLVATLLALAAATVVVPSAMAASPAAPKALRLTVTAPVAGPDQGGFGGSAEWDQTNVSDVGANLKSDEILLGVGGGTAHRSFEIDLQAPTGQAFHPGSYYGDDPYGVRGEGSLDFGSTSCDKVAFTIVDLAVSGSTITRLDVQFQDTRRCSTPISGELQIGEPDPAPGLLAGVRSFSWPDVPVGTRSAQMLPVWFRNTGVTAVRLGSVGLTGAAATDFALAKDNCSNRSLVPGAGCSISVGFDPKAAGLRQATLQISAGGGEAHVLLGGSGPAGRSVLLINSQPGDFVANGLSSVITEAQAPMSVGNLGSDDFQITVASAPYPWSVTIRTPDGSPVALGTHRATNDPTGPDYLLIVTGYGRGCGGSNGSVTVKQVAFDADHAPSAFDATFSQSCGGSGGKQLTGEIAYRATDTSVVPTAPFALRTGQNLLTGRSMLDDNGGSDSYRLAVGSDGRAGLTDDGGPVYWATPTAGTGTANRLQLFADGTLAVLTAANRVVWQVEPVGHQPGDFLVLQSDGNLVLYSPGYVPLWASNTARPPG